jgi:hypothetical protein
MHYQYALFVAATLKLNENLLRSVCVRCGVLGMKNERVTKKNHQNSVPLLAVINCKMYRFPVFTKRPYLVRYSRPFFCRVSRPFQL